MRRDDPGPYSLDALKALPVPALFTRDATVLKARYIAWFEQATGRTLYPMQVEMLLIEALAYAMATLGEEAQMTVEQHLVALATIGLDQLGPNRSTPRLPASKARVTMRFSLDAIRDEAVTIAEASRVSAGSAGLAFLTLTPAVIAAGSLSADVTAEASLEGTAGNGFMPGQLSAMLDPVAGVSAANVTTSEGGADIEDLDQWRLRIANAFDRVSSAGGKGWYREEAMKVSPAIVDVAVTRPQPCFVDIYPLTESGAAGPDLRDQVKAAFNTDEMLDFRFGDEVSVKPPTPIVATPTLTVRVRGTLSGVQAVASTAAQLVLDDWRTRLAPVIAPSEIEDKVKAALKARLIDVVDAEVTDMPFAALGASEYLVAVLNVVPVSIDGGGV